MITPLQSSKPTEGAGSSGDLIAQTSPLRSHDLPAEIWCMIFKLHRLKPSDLQSIMLTQRSFRPLAQPLIFRTVEVTTCNPDDSLYALQNQQSQDYINRFRDRLAFITSDHIANAVRRIHIHCISRVKTDKMTDCTQIHTALFAALHRFNNLTTLEACSIQFTEDIITSIFSLPRLRTIRLQSCRTDPSIPALGVEPKSGVIELSYTEVESHGHSGNRQVGPTGDPWWLRLLSREKTEEIVITQGHNAVILFQFLSEGPAMQELATLEISSKASPSLFLDAMVQCPVIEGFKLTYPYWRGEELTQVTNGLRDRNAFSELIDIKGPFEFVYPLLEDRSIEDISVTLMGEEESYRLVSEIRQQGLYLVYLKLDISRVQMEFIQCVVAFSTLEWLEISTDMLVHPNIMGGNKSIQQICLFLQSASLPKDLEFLSMYESSTQWMADGTFGFGSRPKDAAEEYPMLIEHLKSECPKLWKFRVGAFFTDLIWERDDVSSSGDSDSDSE